MTVPFCVPSDHRVVATRQWGRVQGLTLAPEGCTQGRREFFWFKPGFYVAMGQVEHRAACVNLYPSGEFFKLHFRLSGRSRVGQAATPHSQHVLPLTMSTLVQPRNSYKEECFTAGEHERSLTICCSRDFLRDELGIAQDGESTHPCNGAGLGFELRQFPMQQAQIDLVDALLNASAAAPHRGLFVEFNASALLHGFLCMLEQRDGGSALSEPVDLNRARMVRLKQYLDTHLGDAVDLAGLAREHGMTVRRLSGAFKQVHGRTVAEYLHSARMMRARQMLELGRASVTDVAFEVGYGHVANFSTAFKRVFGVSPLAVRRSSLA